MKQSFKRFLSLVLAIVMVFSMFTGNIAYAADEVITEDDPAPAEPLATEGENPDEGDDTQEPQGEADDDPHEHVYVGVETLAATCTAEGVMTYTCECNDSYTEAISVVSHSYEEGVCTVCGEIEVVAADVVYVAKVGDTEYATIDEAIANWANNTTLTLLDSVTLTDVIKLSSTEKHVLDLGTYTMTAATSKDAIQIENNGRSSASYALDIKADATNPGGITATGKAIVRTAGKSGVKDRPIIRFYNGVFNASYIVYHTGSNGTNCPQFQFHGGEYNGTVYTDRTLNQFYGGTFNGSLMMSVDSSAYTLIAGGTFKQLSNLFSSSLTSNKFAIGSAKGVFDREVYVNDTGYYVVAANVPAEGFEVAVEKNPGTDEYLKYSKVATEGVLKYTNAKMALQNNKSAKVTVYVDELDLAGISFTGTIVVPEGETLTITNAPEGLKYEGNVVFDLAGSGLAGSGTVRDPYQISSKEELITFRDSVNEGDTKYNTAGVYVALVSDIDLDGETWTPIASFTGNFVGNNHTISNFNIDATAGNAGFFNEIAGSNGLEDVKVQNLILSDVTATVGNARFGTLANSIAGVVHNVTVQNVTVTTTNSNAWVGGMTAFMDWPYMTNCTVENLTVDAQAGAEFIAGFACILQKNSNHVFDNLDVKGFKVTVNDTDGSCGVGGFVGQTQRGWEYPKVINCDVTGIDVTASGTVDVGGFIAWPGAHTTAENCTTEGKIDVTGVTSSNCFAGGFFGNLGWNCDLGKMGHVVTNCSADVDIITKVAPAGGFVGSATNSNNNSMYATFNNCAASGDVTCIEGGTAPIGGFAGDADRGVYNNCTASGTVTNSGTGYAGQFIGAFEDVTPKYDSRYPAGTRDYLVDESTLDGCTYTGTSTTLPFIGNTAEGADVDIKLPPVAKVGETGYPTLKEAVEAANGIEGGATVTLLDNVTLGEKLTISGNVTISGEYAITRDDAYTGTLFAVNAGAALTLDGGLVIDGGNEWTLNTELYNKALNREVTGVTWADLITSEENAPNATAAMFVVNGSVVANDLTIQNNYSTKDSNGGDGGIFKVEANATLTMTGAQIKHIVTGGANSVAHLSTNAVWTINDGTLITDTFAARNGGICRNDSGKFVMNGGTIEKNNSLNTNGTVVMLYKGSMEMNGGKICSNTGISGTNNGRCAPIYGHSTSTFIMTDGEICHNTGISYGGVDVPSSIKVEISGGYIGENISVIGNTNADVNGNANTVISGGTFTQDVSQWLAPNIGLVYDETTGKYTTTDHIYNLYFRDPATGEQVVGVGPLQGNDMASLVATGKLFYADYYVMELEVLSNVKIDTPVVIDYPMVVNLNGKTITGVDVYPVIRVQGGADVTVKGGNINNDDYIFVLGASDGSSAGNLTIESGKYHGDTTVASVTKGTLNIAGGEFSVDPYEDSYAYLLNCIDANYKDGSAKIEVKGGEFFKYDPSNNAAEGVGTNFCADGYIAEELTENYFTVRKVNYVAQVGDVKYESLKAALEACTNGETVKLIDDITYDADDIVYAHGGATGFGNYDQYNPSIIYIGGTKGTTAAENQPSNVNAVLDLNGHTISSSANAYLFLIMDNAKVTFKDSGDGGQVFNNSANYPAIWAVGTETLVTIESGEYVTDSATGLLHSTHSADMVITGGDFRTIADDASLLVMLNTQKYNNPNYFLQGIATVSISGGTFHGFNPEKVGDDYGASSIADIKFVNGCADCYVSVDNGDGTYGVKFDPVAQVGESYYATLEAAIEAASKLDEKVVTVLKTIELTEDGTLDLQGVRLNAASTLENTPIIRVLAKIEVVNAGIIDGGSGINSYAFIVGNSTTAGELTITSGTYRGVTSAISITNGVCNISGGTFQTKHDDEGTNYGTTYLLNCLDSAYNAGTAKFNITGGKFVGFNPESNAAEGEGTNFLEGNYKASDYYGDNKWYVAEALVEMDGNKYFATIKDALAILTSADTTVHKVKVLQNLEIDVNYSTYNYPILVNGFSIELDLNGKTITADWSKYTGTRVDNAIIGVCNGGKLDIIDSVDGGKIVNNDEKTNVENRIFWIMTSTADKSIVVNIKGGTFVQNDVNTALLYVQGNRPADNLAPMYVNITGGHFESVNDDFFNAYDGYQHESYITGGTFNKNPTDWEIKIAEGFKVEQNEDGTYGVVPMNYVAKIGVDKFESLSDAIAAATPGDTIDLIDNVTEDVTVNKNLTIDGAEFNYTGTVSVNTSLNVTVQNVNFVKGSITEVKGEHGNLTIKNCDFDGVDSSIAYAITVRGNDNIVIENSTAKNYSTGMLYIPSTLNTISVKDVVVENVAAAFNILYCNSGMFENVTVKNATYGVHSANYGNRTFTLKGCDFECASPIYVPKKGTATVVFAFEGTENTFITETAYSSNYTTFLLHKDSVLTAPELFNVNLITDVADHKVVYEEGVYKVVPKVYVAQIGDVKYETLQAAIDACVVGENTVTLIAECDEDVTIKQAEGINIIINGAQKTYSGTFTIHGSARYTGEETLKFQNIKFVTEEASHYFIDSNSTASAERYAHNVTVEGCTFEATGEAVNSAVALRIRQGFNISLTGNTYKGLHSALQGYGIAGVTVTEDTVTGCKSGYSVGTSTNVKISGVNIDVVGYGIRADGTADSDMTVTGGSISAELPIVVRNTTGAYNLTVEGCTLTADNDGYQVIFTNGDDGTYEVPTGKFVVSVDDEVKVFPDDAYVAQIGEKSYITLAAAIDAATAGDTITFLTSINEDVTVNKSVTVDGAEFNYTGKMTLNKVNVTIQNVNFVKGNIYKNKNTGVGGNFTIKNCDFDGQDLNDYAVNLGGTSKIVIEGCTAMNYGYGFLQVPASNTSVSVKDVEVSDVNYGFKIDYSNGVTLENVDVDAAVAGVLNSNYGAKTITIKNCDLSILGTWKRNDTTKTTYVFEGANTIGEFKTEAALDTFKLADVNSTLTAPEGQTVTTDVEGYEVEYKDGKYVLVDIVRVAQIGETKYKTLAAAIAAATPGDTIILIDNVTEDVTVNKSVTIDGAEFNYTGKMNATASVTIKNVNFDGKGYNGYAVETRGAATVVIEDCTAKNYGYGFLQVVSNNNTVVVKNVVVSNVNYGVKIDYSNGVTLENVVVDAAVAGVLNSNYGKKTITIKDSDISILGTWTRNNTVKTTIVFEGTNTVDEFVIDAAIDVFKLADVNSTLTAPNDITVITDIADHKVAYENGMYKVVAKVYVAQIGEVKYESLAEAIAEVKNGETITLLADCDETVTIKQTAGLSFTIDGNNKTYSGTIKVDGNNRPNGAETLTIQNVNFKKTDATGYSYFIDATKNAQDGNSEVHNLTVDNCTFESNNWHYAIATRHPYNLVVKNCTAEKVYYFIYNPQGGKSMTVENCEVTNATYGIGAQKCQEVSVKDYTYTGKAAGFYGRANATGSVATLENVNITTTLGGQSAVTLWKNNDGTTSKLYTFNFVGKNVLTTPEGTASFAAQSETNSPYVLQLGNVNATLTATEGLPVTLPNNEEFADYKVVYENGTYLVAEKAYVAELNGVKYEYLQDAVDACVAGDNTITLLTDCDQTVTIKQKANVNIAIEGADMTYTGTINVNGNGRSTGAETLTILNVNFVAEGEWQSSVYTEKSTFAHNLTIDGCTFTGTDAKQAYGIRLRHAYNITVKNTRGTKLYDLVYANNAVTGFTAENVTVTDSGMGFMMSYGTNLSFKNVEIEASGAAIGIYNNSATTATFENCTITGATPIRLIQQNATNSYTLIFNGDNDLAATEGEVLVSVEGTDAMFKVVVNDETLALTKDNTNGLFAKVGEDGNIFYNRVQDAVNAAEAEAVVYVIDNANQSISVSKNLGLEVGENELLGDIEVAENAALTIYSGTFNDHTAKVYVVEGMVAMDIEDDKWTVTDPVTAGFVAQNTTTGDYFKLVSDAMDAALEGETVILLTNCEDKTVFVDYGATLDLNGYILTASRVATFDGHIIDSSEANSGVLDVDQRHFIPANDNKQLPVWTEDGYQFVEIKKFNAVMNEGKFVFQPVFEAYANELLVTDGVFNADAGVSIVVRANWISNGEAREQDFVFSSEQVAGYINSYYLNNKGNYVYKQMFTLKLNNVPEDASLTYTAVVESAIGTEHLSQSVEH